MNTHVLMTKIQQWGQELGFSQIGWVRLADLDLSHASHGLRQWLAAQHHGDMHYMAARALLRENPQTLVPGTVGILTARMDYLPQNTPNTWRQEEQARLKRSQEAVISVYARGRDYHKVMRKRLQQLSERIAQHLTSIAASHASDGNTPWQSRVFVDSAPIFEVELASQSGLGWRGKHTLLLQRQAGSAFFLGEIFVNLDLTAPAAPMLTSTSTSTPKSHASSQAHCGTCQACISACPTHAIVAPYRLDARRCISYLTIEHSGEIPVALRRAMGNRIYGCDDCQTACPWNKFAQRAVLADFDVREGMQGGTLLELFLWDEATFLHRTEGSAIRRIGYERWQRNLAVALGNALHGLVDEALQAQIRAALAQQALGATPLVKAHIEWALGEGEALGVGVA